MAFIPPPTAEDIDFLYNRPLKDRLRDRVKTICAKIRPSDSTCGVNVKTYRDLDRFINYEAQNLA